MAINANNIFGDIFKSLETPVDMDAMKKHWAEQDAEILAEINKKRMELYKNSK
jgi:hypothetical protein